MFAELVTADFVLADISILNANVFYELGIRHTVGPRGVICLHAGWANRPFDVAPQRTFKYDGQLFRVGLARDAAWEKKIAAEVSRLGQTLKKAVAADRRRKAARCMATCRSSCRRMRVRSALRASSINQANPTSGNQRLTIAGKEGHAEDIPTLAGDVRVARSSAQKTAVPNAARRCSRSVVLRKAEKIFEESCRDADWDGQRKN